MRLECVFLQTITRSGNRGRLPPSADIGRKRQTRRTVLIAYRQI
jgi:hypothetical protein